MIGGIIMSPDDVIAIHGLRFPIGHVYTRFIRSFASKRFYIARSETFSHQGMETMQVKAFVEGDWVPIHGTTVSLIREEGGAQELRLVMDDQGHIASHEIVSLEA